MLFFLKIVLDVPDALHFLIHFSITLIISTHKKKACWDFNWNCIEFIDQFGVIDMLVICSLLIHKHFSSNLFRP